MDTIKTHVITASTRPGRKGPKVAQWFVPYAQRHGALDVQAVDLMDMQLPLFDEPKHPRFAQYEHEHTKRWSKLVAEADAFIFVTPEYNYGTPPSLLNALTYLAREWAYAPVAFVSYGGASGGLRSVQMTKQTVTTLKMMPLPDGVSFPFFDKLFKDDGSFDPGTVQDKAIATMLDELVKWATALKPLRAANR